MKILSGVYQPDEGVIRYHGKPVHFQNATEAMHAGISIIDQELNLVKHLTVGQNIFIGREPRTRLGFIDDEKINRDASEVLEKLNINIDPSTPLYRLPISKQQMVEIAKALSHKSEVLIMDEPTSALTESEIDELFKLIHNLRDSGVAIIYISHRLEELKHIVDRITIFRDGKYMGTSDYASISTGEIISRMVGRRIDNLFPPRTRKATGKKLLEVKNITRAGILKGISFDLFEGEILGIAGLMGAGRSELARAIFGADPIDAGEVTVKGKSVRIRSPADAISNGIAYLSENRKEEGLAINMRLTENITLSDVPAISKKFGILSKFGEMEAADKFVRELEIKTPSIFQIVNNLSGGNQQKTVVAKWLFCESCVLFFDEPTRGIDVGAKYAIYELMDHLAASGAGIVMISSDLSEILGLTDRVLVLHEGELAATLQTNKTTQEEILRFAAGVDPRSTSQTVESIER
jgi:ribose transport system ATP-binding protein